jgi:signal transduction histidine kinase
LYEAQNKTLHNYLRQVPLFLHLKNQQFESIERGKELWLEAGDILVTEGNFWGSFCVLLEGELEWTKNIGDREIHVLGLKTGAFFGHELFFSDIPYPVTVRAVSSCYLFLQDEEFFWNMLTVNPLIARKISTIAVHRLRNLEVLPQQYAKLNSLGTIAAGLAHELNNPAAAACRAVQELCKAIDSSRSLCRQIHRQSIQDISQILIEIEHDSRERAKTFKQLPQPPDLLTQSDREEELIDWLENHGVVNAWKVASTFVSIGLDREWLNTSIMRLPSDASIDFLLWLEVTLSIDSLLKEARESVWRISHLVEAVKNYSFMDRAPQQEIDVQEGIENTLIILGQKLKDKGIAVIRTYYNNLPRICAYGSELNQVWTNLIDNAIDAVSDKIEEAGKIWISTSLSKKHVLVEIADNGIGISTEFKERLFEPFFTTKGVGKGTGLGLSTVYRIVISRHKGNIHFDSKPGNTRFQIFLPLTQS